MELWGKKALWESWSGQKNSIETALKRPTFDITVMVIV